MTEPNQMAKRDKTPLAMTNAGVQFSSVEEAFRFAEAVIATGFAPKGDNAQAVMVKMQAGLELGMTPIQAMQSFVVVNGRLTMYGEAALGKIRSSGVCEHLVIGNDGEGDARCGFVEFKRRDMGTVERVTFTFAEAKQAGLAGKDTYKSYRDDMLVWRAVSRCAKRYFSDVTRGFDVGEIVREHRPIERVQPERRALAPGTPDPIFAALPPSRVPADADGAALDESAIPKGRLFSEDDRGVDADSGQPR